MKFKTNVFCLRENQTFDIKKQKQLEKYKKININKMNNYIESLKNKKYEYENDKIPETTKLINDVKIASEKLLERVNKFNIKLKSNVYIKIGDENIKIIKGQDQNRELYCELDLKLLNRIIHKKAHWNNAEIGTHISFRRIPNKMDPDVHTCMSFFHL